MRARIDRIGGRLGRLGRGRLALAGLAALVAAGGVVAALDRGPSTPTGARSTLARNQAGGLPATAPGGTASAAGGGATATDAKGAEATGAAGVPAVASGPSGVVPTAGEKIVKTADVRVRVAAHGFGRAFDRAAEVAAAHHGYVAASSTASADDGTASGDLTIRVPAAEFDAARRDLGALGKVESQSISGQDVSGQLVDYDARIRSLQAQEDVLRTLLSKATNIGDVLNVQNQLFGVRQQIEQLQAQRAQLDDAATLSTIHVALFEPGASPVPKPEPEPSTGLARDLRRAWDGAVAVVGGMVVVVGYATPFALLALLGWLATRLRRRPSVPTA